MGKLNINSFRMPSVPVRNLLIIKTLTSIPSHLYYSILDLSGREIIKNKIIETYEDFIQISIDFLKSGMYILRLEDEDTFIMSSFQVEVS
jgi:hypothetical protein